MPIGDAFDDGETESAARFGVASHTVEPVEHAAPLRVRNARAFVIYLKTRFAVCAQNANIDSTTCRRIADSVIEQIAQEDPQSLIVSEYLRGVCGYEAQIDATVRSQRRVIPNNGSSEFIEPQRGERMLGGIGIESRQSQQLMHQMAGAGDPLTEGLDGEGPFMWVYGAF